MAFPSWNRSLHQIIIALGCSAVGAAPALAAEATGLRGYNAAIAESSISGISSGAYMAVQFATAWSSVVRGVGVIAGGPFWCAKADAGDVFTGYSLPVLTATGPCMKGPPPDMNDLLAKLDSKVASGDIDPIRSLRLQKIYLFHGFNDSVVAKSVTDATAELYQHYLGNTSRGNLYYQTALGAGHSLVVLREPNPKGLNDCNDNDSPYIDQCGYDQAGIILQYIYGALNPPNRGKLTGKISRFDQSLYTQPDGPASLSLGDNGYVFVPKDCAEGAECRVHIALHGCKQDADDIGQRFIDDTGYNSWADSNHLIILYPQTKSSWYFPSNPEACWDWWSYVNHEDNYVTKSGSQIRTIKAMLDALTAGAVTEAGKPATENVTPEALSVIDTSDSGVALVWAPVENATAYSVWRAEELGQFAPIGKVAGPSFGDSNLAPRSPYRWRVSAIINGLEGPTSAEVAATTRPKPEDCDTPGTCPIGQ
jgi:hypothetical protein